MSSILPADLLKQLREARPGTDWRRDRPHPQLPVWQAALEAGVAGGGMTPLLKLEAQALMSRLAIDPLATLQGFLEFQERAPSVPAYVARMVQELVSHWGDAIASIRVRIGQQAARSCQDQAEALLHRWAQTRPADAQAQLALVTFLRASAGTPAALAHICSLSQPPAELVREYFDLLVDRALRLPDADSIQALFIEPLPFKAPISIDMLRFRFHRAVVVQNSMWSSSQNTAFGNAGLREALMRLPSVDAVRELEGVLNLLPLLSADDQAPALMSLMACPALWRSPATEAVRLMLLDAAMNLAPQVADSGLLTSLVARLIDYMPQSIRYWESPEWQRRLYSLVCQLSPQTRLAQRHYFRGISAFPLQELDVVKAEYRAATEVEPTASRFTSYLDPRSVLACRSDNILNADAVLWDQPNGTYPAGARLIVATSADENYFRRYGVGYAKSLQKVGFTDALHIHIIGRPSAVADEISQVRQILAGSDVTVSSEKPVVDRAFYYASARFLRLGAMLRRFEADILMTDIDLVWHTAPERWTGQLRDVDVGLRIFDAVRNYVMRSSGEIILRFPRTKLWECTSASSILLRNTPAALGFADLLSQVASHHLRRFLDKPGTHWFIDQNILSAVYAHVLRHENIRIGNLDAVGTPYSPFDILNDAALKQARGGHWIASPEPFASLLQDAAPVP
jgi:hypothetical protein